MMSNQSAQITPLRGVSGLQRSGKTRMIIVIQIMSAMALGVMCYMIAVAMTVYDGILSMIFQPIMGGIFSAIAVVALLIVGFPIRVIPALNRIWKKYWWFSLILGGIAVGMMIFSWLPEYRAKVFDPELKQEVDSFNPTLSIGGWCVLLFAVLHFYPPIAFLYPKRSKDKAEPGDPPNTLSPSAQGVGGR